MSKDQHLDGSTLVTMVSTRKPHVAGKYSSRSEGPRQILEHSRTSVDVQPQSEVCCTLILHIILRSHRMLPTGQDTRKNYFDIHVLLQSLEVGKGCLPKIGLGLLLLPIFVTDLDT